MTFHFVLKPNTATVPQMKKNYECSMVLCPMRKPFRAYGYEHIVVRDKGQDHPLCHPDCGRCRHTQSFDFQDKVEPVWRFVWEKNQAILSVLPSVFMPAGKKQKASYIITPNSDKDVWIERNSRVHKYGLPRVDNVFILGFDE